MSKVFWFTGRSGSGKTTLTKKLYSNLKDKTKIITIDCDKLLTETMYNSGILSILYFYFIKHYSGILSLLFLYFLTKKMKWLIAKNAVEQANGYSQSDVTLIIIGSRKILDCAKEQFHVKYKEIYLKCSMECSLKRRHQSSAAKCILNIIKNFYTFFEDSKFPNIIIDTEHQSIEESFQTLLYFIEKETVITHNKMS